MTIDENDMYKIYAEDNSPEYIAEKKQAWLKDFGSSFKDVMQDEDGEFIMVESDTGSPHDEGYMVNWKKVYLPDFTKL